MIVHVYVCVCVCVCIALSQFSTFPPYRERQRSTLTHTRTHRGNEKKEGKLMGS